MVGRMIIVQRQETKDKYQELASAAQPTPQISNLKFPQPKGACMQPKPRIEVLLEEVIKKKASDLHLQVGLPPMLRVDGSLIPVTGADVLDEEAVESLIFAILDED